MTNNENKLSLLADTPSESRIFWMVFVGLLAFVFLLHAKTVPFSNEFPYLLRLIKEFQPEFLLNDWTFSAPANEHWLFNRIFGFPALFVQIEILGWLGRIAVWSLTLIVLLRIGKLWEISLLKTAAVLALWLALGQSMVADEWIIGGFEAKSVSYIFLLTALYRFSLRQRFLPAILLGIAFAFHPAVGLWSALAVGVALIWTKIPLKTVVVIGGLILLFALPGIVPLFFEQFADSPDSAEAWRYVILVRFPWHFDPFYFSKSATLLLLGMFVFNFVFFRRSEYFAMQFLLKFQIALAIFFLAAFVLRWLELFEWLRFLPVRLFPVFTPLFFGFSVFRAWSLTASKQSKILVAMFILAVVFRLNPAVLSFEAMRNTYATWTAAPDDFQATSEWIATNTPNGTIIIQPPHRRDVWYRSQRATVVSYAYQTFGRLDEWSERVKSLTSNVEIADSQNGFQIVETAFNRLSESQINEIHRHYGAKYLVSRGEYSFPVVFQTETYKIYFLSNN